MSTLPQGWQKRTLAETCDILSGFGFPERLQGKTSGDLPFYKVGDISETWKRGDTYLTTANHYLAHSEASEIRARPLPKNTTVFAKIGAAIALNRRAILSVPALVDNNVMGLHAATDALDHKFLFHFACTLKLDKLSRATTVPSVRKSDIEQIPILVPPIPEQRQIVAEIEKQFTRLNAGIAALRRTQANLKRYRAAVLKAACEGRLVPTEAELQKGYETGEQLLARILAERRKSWKGRGQYKEPATPGITNVPSLPDGWTWATVEQLASKVQYGHTASAVKREAGVRFLRITDIQDRRVEWDSVPSCDISPSDVDELRLLPGDIVFARTGATVGKSFLLKAPFPASVFASYLIRISPAGEDLSLWLHAFFQSPDYWAQIRESSAGIGQPNVNGTKLQALRVPLPPLVEQARIVEEVERRLSVVEELEALASTNLQRATRLRQSILQLAFTGSLVPQDANVNSPDLLSTRIHKMKIDTPEPTRKIPMLKKSSIAKSNHFRSVLDALGENGKALTPEELFALCGRNAAEIREVERFFDELRELIDAGQIEEMREDKATVTIRAKI